MVQISCFYMHKEIALVFILYMYARLQSGVLCLLIRIMAELVNKILTKQLTILSVNLSRSV